MPPRLARSMQSYAPMPERTTPRERLLITLSRWRVQLGFCFAGPALLCARPTPRSYASFLPVVVAGVLLRVWARGHLDRAERVCTGGPYGHLRHPLYVGSFLMGLGVALMALPLPFVPLYCAVFVGMYLPKALREERYLAGRFGERYAVYATRVPAVVPQLASAGGGAPPSAFEWQRVWRHREWRTWVGVGTVLLFVGWRLLTD